MMTQFNPEKYFQVIFTFTAYNRRKQESGGQMNTRLREKWPGPCMSFKQHEVRPAFL